MTEPKGIKLRGLTKEYISEKKEKFLAVNNIDLDIKPGEFVTLLGPSGCGKTTTLRMIAGFEMPTAGDIFLGDKKINSLTPDKRNTAMVFQSYALFPHYNVYNNIAYGLRLRKFSDQEIQKKVHDIIALVGLEGMNERFPNQISGGQQQRVALARALVMEPDVMLFDEPLSNLDAKLRIYMRTEIRKIQRRLGLTSVYVTHDQSEAMSLSDRIIIMNEGIIEQIGSPQEIYQHPSSKFVADFIGRANFFEARVESSGKNGLRLNALGSNLNIESEKTYKAGDVVTAMIRPESIELGESGQFDAMVELSTFMGSSQEYFVRVGDDVFNVEESNPMGKCIFDEGERVKVTFPAENVHVINKKD